MTRSEITFWVFIVLALALSFFALSAISAPKAHATDWDWSITDNYHTRQQPRRARRHARRAPDRDDIRLYRKTDETVERDFKVCLGPVRGVGTQWIGEDGALQAARKDWMERVRFDLGETFLDMTHAEGFVQRCGRTSIGETLGQVFYRCEIVARPCKATFTEAPAEK